MIEVEIDSVESLLGTLNELPNSYIYRGQASAAWPLTSSLERIIGETWSKQRAIEFEEFSLLEFQSKFHLYDRENLGPESKLSWLAAMQHYGVPTRLVDFTTSPYVALYFALETYNPSVHGDFAVFAIDYTALMERSLELVREHDKQFNETRKSIYGNQDEVFDQVIARFAHPIAWTTEPRILNTRLDRQAGAFLLSGDEGIRIAEVLKSTTYQEVDVKKFVIAKELYEGAFALLRKMNLTSKSLYGDLEGLAKSIRMQMIAYAVP